MAEIKKLAPHVAAQIAAGEVVERPASVIKELVENAIDALATRITVEIKHGGITYMRVTDNGKGMAEEDVPTAFLRHATSKIENGEDLESIVTLGFRGEALYSIAAVSRVELLTKRTEDEIGTGAVIMGGGEPEILPAGCPDGTSITVKDLFFNTPARMKFLKKDSAEAGYIEEVLRKIALARPDISFRYISGGKEIFFTPGDGSLENAVSAIWGREYTNAMLPVEYEQDGVKITGLIGKSELTRPNRMFQIFFVNGRAVMHRSFLAAIAESYKGQIMQGRFPVCVLHLNVDPALCDVNVHPSKAEIKFANEKPVFDVIYWGAKNSLYAIRDTRTLHLKNEVPKEPALPVITGEQIKVVPPVSVKEVIAPVKKETADTKKETATIQEKKETVYTYPVFSMQDEPTRAAVTHSYATRTEVKEEVQLPTEKTEADMPKEEETEKPSVSENMKLTVEKEAEIQEIQPKQEEMPYVRVLGQAFDTYIIAEAEGKLLLVDQHAAHERIIYNTLLEGMEGKGIDSQMLLMPVSVRLSPSEMAVFSENSELLYKAGFDAEEFGDKTVKISMIPAALADCDPGAAFLEVIEKLLSSSRDLKTSAETHALYTIACKAAMKAGKQLPIKEQEALVQKAIMLDGIATCPHGRPVILSLTQKEIEKQFKRIV